MKYIQYISLILLLASGACNKVIDLYPQSNLNTGTYYSNFNQLQAGLTGVYNGLQLPMQTEWQLTELRSDNSRQGVPASTSSQNRDLSDLDMFIPATTHEGNYNYWLSTYNNIRNANIILQNLGVTYDAGTGAINLTPISITLSDVDRKQLAGEALFIRAHHYFNLVRLYGGVFLVTTPISATDAKTRSRASVADIYKLIEADLTTAASYMSNVKFNQIANINKGRVNSWSAKALLGKVFLTQNKKAEALASLNDVRLNSGYSLQTSYANIFSITNEMNSEVLFAVRYKAGGFGLGASFGNDFGPLNSGAAVINGSGRGWNTPTTDIDTAYVTADARRNVNIAIFGTGSNMRIYVKKFLNPVILTDDGEGDWPVIRYADVLLMLAEAGGFTTESIGYINQIRTRAQLPVLNASVNNTASFEQALSNERRLEFAFENQRFFDLLRFNTTLSTIKAEQVLKSHFSKEYAMHYSQYLPPTPTLAELQGYVVSNRLLLPIPQREIDTNTQLIITQNPGY